MSKAIKEWSLVGVVLLLAWALLYFSAKLPAFGCFSVNVAVFLVGFYGYMIWLWIYGEGVRPEYAHLFFMSKLSDGRADFPRFFGVNFVFSAVVSLGIYLLVFKYISPMMFFLMFCAPGFFAYKYVGREFMRYMVAREVDKIRDRVNRHEESARNAIGVERSVK